MEVYLEMFPRKRRISKKELEEQVKYTEEILQPEIIATPGIVVTKKEQREKKRLLRINSKVSIYLPENEEIKIEWEKDTRGDYLYLQRAGKTLDVWLDPTDNYSIGIGDKDYYITREDKLIELAEGGIFDLVPRRKPGSKDYQLVKNEEGRLVINLRAIEDNDQIKELFLKRG